MPGLIGVGRVGRHGSSRGLAPWMVGFDQVYDFTKDLVGVTDTHAQAIRADDLSGLYSSFAADVLVRTNKGIQTTPTAQNYISAPSDFSNAFWGKDALTIVTDQAANFDGSITMDKLVETAASSAHHVYNYSIVTATSGAWYTAYGYARIGERGFLRVNPAGTGSPVGSTNTFYDLTTGVVTQGGNADVVGRMSPAGNGLWYCELSVKAASAAGLGFQLAPAPAVSNIVYAGDAAKGVYVGGWNFRAGQFGVPPIGSATTITGNQPVIDLTGKLATGVRGIIRVNVKEPGSNFVRILDFNDGGNTNRISFNYASGGLNLDIYTANVYQGGVSLGAWAQGVRTITFAVATNYAMARVVGASAPSADTSLTYPSLTRAALGGSGFNASSNTFQNTMQLALGFGAQDANTFADAYAKGVLLAAAA